MKHLSDEALVDLAEGGIGGRDHLVTCAKCRERVESMRQMMGALLDDRVPEPSPLYWEHLSNRVSRGISDGLTPTSDWRALFGWGWVAATVVAIVIAALLIRSAEAPDLVSLGDGSGTASTSQVTRDSASAASDISWAVAAVDEPWQIVEGAAADLDLDAAVDAGIVMRGGSLDRELLMLSDQERRDLARVIKAEVDRSRL